MVRTTQADPIALVLSGGGARGAYQTGVLAAIAERCGHDNPFPIVTGVSAGSINAVYLAGNPDPFLTGCRRLAEAWLGLTLDHVFHSEFHSIFSSGARWAWTLASGGRLAPEIKGLLDTQPLKEYLSRTMDFSAIGRNIEQGQLIAAALSATSYNTGLTTTFVQAKPDIAMWKRAGRIAIPRQLNVDHVLASSALPLIFPAVRIGNQYYGDGSIRLTSPLAPAIHLGARKILAISIRYRRDPAAAPEEQFQGYPPAGQIFGMLLNAIFMDALEGDCERLARINRTLDLLGKRRLEHPEGLRQIRFLVLRPSRDLGQLAAGMEKTLPSSLRRILRGFGVQKLRAPDLISYLLFERPYIQKLIELGYDDAMRHWQQIEAFFEAPVD